MRLTPDQIQAIKQTAETVLGRHPYSPGVGHCTTNWHSAMSLRYLPEHAQAVQFALDLARKEAAHLRYSQRTLFAQAIDLDWVQSLGNHPEIAEKVEAFVSGFGILQDHLGDKLLSRLAALVGESSKTLLDRLAVSRSLPSA